MFLNTYSRWRQNNRKQNKTIKESVYAPVWLSFCTCISSHRTHTLSLRYAPPLVLEMEVIFPTFVHSSQDNISTNPPKKEEKSLLQLVVEAGGKLGLVPQRQVVSREETVNDDTSDVGDTLVKFSSWVPCQFVSEFCGSNDFRDAFYQLCGIRGKCSASHPVVLTVEDLGLPPDVERGVRRSFETSGNRGRDQGNLPNLDELKALVFPTQRVAGTLLKSLQQTSFSYLLSGFHGLLCGPSGCGKKTAAQITAGIRVLEQCRRTENSSDEFKALLVVSDFRDIKQTVRSMGYMFGFTTFSFHYVDGGEFVPYEDDRAREPRKRQREEPAAGYPILCATGQALQQLLQNTEHVSSLPLEHIQACVFFNMERFTLPPLNEAFNSLLWQSLIGVVDVNCQFIFTCDRLFMETYRLVSADLFRHDSKRVAFWVQEDQTVWSLCESKIVPFPVEHTQAAPSDYERIAAEKTVQVASMILNKAAHASSATDGTASPLKVVVVVSSKKEQEAVLQNLASSLEETTVRVCASAGEFINDETNVLVVTDFQLHGGRESGYFRELRSISSIIHFSLPRKPHHDTTTDEDDITQLRYGLADRLRAILQNGQLVRDISHANRLVENQFPLTEYQQKGKMGDRLRRAIGG
ncbi:hypothetical protein, conserved [Angomonas deanei]|uniref:Uncharacterized protein n=1 Tax=Angomonas deanei TaxID=59799 RepID=A0A7G2BZ07_9TRYP|nr:hypothetical protein, conserved [Angomonas deanei]